MSGAIGDGAIGDDDTLILPPSTLGAGIVSVFSPLPAAIALLRRDRLLRVAANYFPDAELTDDYLLEKLIANEKMLERDLHTYFTPREVLPTGSPQAEYDALVAAGNVVVDEPGYDYGPEMFAGNEWGLIVLRNKPLIAVHSIQFVYPGVDNSVYVIPIEWVRADKKYSRINIVPVQTSISLVLNSWILSVLGGGQTVPLMLQIRYRCGLANAAQDYPDLLDVIKKMTVLSIIEDEFMPGSGSISADGLSQSISFDAQKYQDLIDKKVEVLRRDLHGIRMMVL